MSVFLEEEGEEPLPVNTKELAESVVEATLDVMDCPYEAEVNVLLTTDEAIQEMNKQFRDTDRPTDVLSFPMCEFDPPGDFSFLEEDEDAFDPESGELFLGDVVISKDHVRAQAQEYGHSILREFAFLLTHSMLHLLGYDHMEETDRMIMEAKQREILEKLKISRDS